MSENILKYEPIHLDTNPTIQVGNLRLLSINEARKTLGIRYETMRKLVDDGRIGYIEIEGKKKISLISLHQYIESNTVQNPPKTKTNIDSDIDTLFEKFKRRI